ncbi:MAG: CPBP family glutamic-type intramembrane protease [Planctomycetes bacterium]|nr:CPBP family glutamic-type intramembrane protease [Planctomycetota bacterium]
MSWRNIRLIYAREIRDQLRDRRTLFMIAVLPLLLYPLLGMSVFQLSQFLRKSEPKILVIGSEQLAENDGLPPLFEGAAFAPGLFDDPAAAARFALEFAEAAPSADQPAATLEVETSPPGTGREQQLNAAQLRLKSGDIQVVLKFPDDFGERLRDLRRQVQAATGGTESRTSERKVPDAPSSAGIPELELRSNSVREKSRAAHLQIEQILNVWKSQIVRENLLVSRVPANIAKPFAVKPLDIAEQRQQEAVLWSKILPFVLFIWALTGAFYPAVDLCAGEKERGTLETLLSSPALRTEIVWGKLLTVMTFSSATAILNLASLGFTAQFIVTQLRAVSDLNLSQGLDLPPLGATLWLLVALVPMSALFSALCLACAAFARSTKEGQYYLMPLLLVTMPLMMLPMAPGTELDLGNSMIPVTGVVLLLKGLVQGNYAEVVRYVVPVCTVTLLCCHLAIRWAVYQFNQESVLFRESERFDLRGWMIHLVRDRQQTPSLAEAFFCVAIIYIIQFFTQLAISANAPATADFGYLTLLLFISQVVCIAVPALLMTIVLTSQPLKTLLLNRAPQAAACVAAILLAVFWHPIGQRVVLWIHQLYPLSEDVTARSESVVRLVETAPYAWLPFLLMAVMPAICEELAFRGFILSGLRHLGHKWWAIGLSAVFFGIAHPVIQQSIAATSVGLVIGYLAVQTGSLVPCILFHGTYNSLMLASTHWPALADRWPVLRGLSSEASPSGPFIYSWPVVVLCGVLAAGLLGWFYRLPYQATKEEWLSDARARQAEHPLPSGLSGNVE